MTIETEDGYVRFRPVTSAQLTADILATIPDLRGYAIKRCGARDQAEDLVQETLAKALSKIDSFCPGTNLGDWMFTILRNVHNSQYRKRRREVADSDGSVAERLASAPAQDTYFDMVDFQEELQLMPADQREALTLVVGYGISYDEAAEVCGCPVGTIKSRVSLARGRLAKGRRVA